MQFPPHRGRGRPRVRQVYAYLSIRDDRHCRRPRPHIASPLTRKQAGVWRSDMRRMIVFALAAMGVFAASGGMASTAGAQAAGWEIPGASTAVAVYPNCSADHM